MTRSAFSLACTWLRFALLSPAVSRIPVSDPDMLEVGKRGMTTTEDRAHFSPWSMMAAPRILDTDVRFMPRSVGDIVTNREVIASDQDPLGVQASIVFRHGDGEVLTKPLANGDRAVLLLNRDASQLTLTVRAEQVGMARAPGYVWSNLWTHTTRTSTGSISESVPPRSAVLLRCGGGRPLQREVDHIGTRSLIPTGPARGPATIELCHSDA